MSKKTSCGICGMPVNLLGRAIDGGIHPSKACKPSKGESAGAWSFEYNGSAGVNIYDSERKIIATVEAYAPKPSRKAFAAAELIAAAPETAAERDRLSEQNTLFRRDNAKLREQKFELLAACESFRQWHANRFGDFNTETNAELERIDEAMARAIKHASTK